MLTFFLSEIIFSNFNMKIKLLLTVNRKRSYLTGGIENKDNQTFIDCEQKEIIHNWRYRK